jgi:CBS domain-containing protein
MSEQHQSYPDLARLRVGDAMHVGLISCPPDASLRTVARMMATNRVHAILVTAHGEDALPAGRPWGIVSDVDLLHASRVGDLDSQPSQSIAATPTPTVLTTDELGRAAELMQERGISHLVVVEPRSTRPIGVLSTLDIARALAGFPERHPFHPER